jgi:hypothetical protein
VAIDEKVSNKTADPADAAVIDNELPAYRAISPGAIVTLVLGIASVFCFTSLWFLVVVALAMVIGLLSIRKIRRLPDVLTGAVYARVGIALALVFGLSPVTNLVVSDFQMDRDASRFATHFTEVIKSQPVDTSLWFQQSPEYRKTKRPDEIAEEVKQVKSPASPDMYKDKTASVSKIKERLRGPNEAIHFAKIESKAVDGLTIYANALIELDGPGTEEFPKEQFALVELTKGPGSGPYDWVVKEIRFPYKPASAVAVVEKKGDDGHGHGH